MENNKNGKVKKTYSANDIAKAEFKKSINNFLSSVNRFWKNIYDVILNNEKDFWVVFFLALWTLFLTIYLSIRVYNNNVYINQRYMDLEKLEKYSYNNDDILFKNKEDNKWFDNINYIIDYYNELSQDNANYDQYIKELSTSYEYLLQYIYLPRLNIWKDLYINKIHTDMIGIKFIENNPYTDSALINKWTSFFQDVWENNEANKVLDISIGDFVEDDKWFFRIPITLSFESDSKRSFLLLLDKLLITSDQENVWLINEFMYYLIQNIKSDKSDEINALVDNVNSEFSWNYFVDDKWTNNENKIIWYTLYNRLYLDWNIDIIDESIINKTIRDVASCQDNMDINMCYYRFRDKYRNIPEMAYNIWRMIINVDRVALLKNFLKNIPPVISIKDLTFNKVRFDNLMWTSSMKYKGKIIIDVFGKWISESEVNEISKALWEKCFSDDLSLNAPIAIKKIDDYMNKISWVNSLDFSKSRSVWELSDIIKSIEDEYWSLTNYNKIIKLFEIYRMLDSANLCEN